jgi:transposase
MGGINPNQKKFNELLKKMKNDEFKYIPKEEKQIDWAKYDKAQINEINNMLLLMRDMADEASRRLKIDELLNGGPGRPPVSPRDLAKAILMQQYFGVSNRVAEGLVLLFREKMRIRNTFSYKTIERAYENPLVTLILHEVFRMTQEPVNDREHSFGIDGSGLSTSIKQNWAKDKNCKGKATKGYEKMIAMVGTSYKLFSAVTFTENPRANESPYLEPLLMETAEIYEDINTVTADSAYLSRHNCSVISSIGATPRIYPKTGITLKQKGSKAWTDMLLQFIDNPQKWLEEYHPRSISETANSTYKRDFPIPLRRKIDVRRKQEAFTRACDYNLKRLCYLKYLEGLPTIVGG